MLARVAIFFVAVVLLFTGHPVQEPLFPGVLAMAEAVDAGKADVQRHMHDGSVVDDHLNEKPPQPFAETGADHSELIPVRHVAIASSRVPGWEGSAAVRTTVPPYLDGPQRPPDANRTHA